MVDVRVVKLHSDMTTPHYAHEGDAGIDLRSSEELVLESGKQHTVKTGLKVAIPEGYVGLIWDKSGYAHKFGIHCLAGVIDSGYRGEIGVVMRNLGDKDFEIKYDMKIAQILIQPIVKANLNIKEDLEDTKRNDGGFGSTGTH